MHKVNYLNLWKHIKSTYFLTRYKGHLWHERNNYLRHLLHVLWTKASTCHHALYHTHYPCSLQRFLYSYCFTLIRVFFLSNGLMLNGLIFTTFFISCWEKIGNTFSRLYDSGLDFIGTSWNIMISALRWTTQWTKLHEVQNSTMYWLTLKYFLNWPLFPRFIQIPFHFHQIFSHFLMMKQLSLFLYAYKTIFTLTLVWYKMLKPFFSFL